MVGKIIGKGAETFIYGNTSLNNVYQLKKKSSIEYVPTKIFYLLNMSAHDHWRSQMYNAGQMEERVIEKLKLFNSKIEVN